MKLPVPMPRLKMPENMAMATVCSDSSAISMIFAWYTMLYPEPDTPHSTHTAMSSGRAATLGRSTANENATPAMTAHGKKDDFA